MSVTTPKAGNNELFHAMVEAGVQAGYPRTDDLNGYQQEGFGPMDRTVTPKGRRASTARGYLDQARSRPNLKIVTHALTDHIVFDGKRAVGVNYLQGDSNQLTHAKARREVLLCAGAIASPQILQRSGVGPAALLKSLDINVVHDLPGVGENLQDHWRCTCSMPVRNRCRCTRRCNGSTSRRSARNGCSTAPASAPATSSRPAVSSAAAQSSRPNIQYHFLPVAINYNGSNAVKEHGFGRTSARCVRRAAAGYR